MARNAAGPDIGETAGALGELAKELSSHRPLMLAALFCADLLPTLVPQIAGRSGTDQVDGWMGACWIAEAAWDALQSKLADPEYAIGDRELLLPLAARCRFLALSEPMRWRGKRSSPWISPEDDDADHPVERVFGTDSWNITVGKCREARRAWLAYLDAYQSHVYLSQAKPEELEQELHSLVFRQPRGARPGLLLLHCLRLNARMLMWLRRSPLGVSIRHLSNDALLTAEDKGIIDEVTDRHLLPRFDLASVIALARHDDSRRGRWARALTGVAVVCAAVASVVCAAVLLIRPAALIAAGSYALIGIGAVAFSPTWAAPWLLRLPAASAVGIIALVSILPGGWLRTPPSGWAAVVALAVAAFGYLLVEARNHGVAWKAALLRALAVAIIGAVHALMVSLIGLVFVAPAFVGSGRGIAALWHAPGYGHSGMDLALATAWCLAVGVFSQILWDDRPITAPLAHLAWRAR
jgi:hypothetical protein